MYILNMSVLHNFGKLNLLNFTIINIISIVVIFAFLIIVFKNFIKICKYLPKYYILIKDSFSNTFENNLLVSKNYFKPQQQFLVINMNKSVYIVLFAVRAKAFVCIIATIKNYFFLSCSYFNKRRTKAIPYNILQPSEQVVLFLKTENLSHF